MIGQLQAGDHPSKEAVEELARLLDVLRNHGWSGSIPADTALREVMRG